MQVELQRGLEQVQHSALHLQHRQAALLTERSRMPGLAPAAASHTAPSSVAGQHQHSGEQQNSQGTDVSSWQQSVEAALQTALDLLDADRTVRPCALRRG